MKSEWAMSLEKRGSYCRVSGQCIWRRGAHLKSEWAMYLEKGALIEERVGDVPGEGGLSGGCIWRSGAPIEERVGDVRYQSKNTVITLQLRYA